MVVGIGIGTDLAIDGAIAHAFTHVIYKGLLFMSMGAVLFPNWRDSGFPFRGLYKTMPWTTGFCIVGAASISAFPLFSGFVSKSIIITEAAKNGHLIVWLCLLFASAGVFHHAGIKNSILCFFCPRFRQAAQRGTLEHANCNGDILLLCIFLGCNPQWLYEMLPNGATGYHPYDATHVITQLEILLFSALAFTLLNLWGKYPPELPSVNLDADWVYRKAGRGFLNFGENFWNGINNRTHVIIVQGLTDAVCRFLKRGQVYFLNLIYLPFKFLRSLSPESYEKNRKILERRTEVGVFAVGWTALSCILFLFIFLLLIFQ